MKVSSGTQKESKLVLKLKFPRCWTIIRGPLTYPALLAIIMKDTSHSFISLSGENLSPNVNKKQFFKWMTSSLKGSSKPSQFIHKNNQNFKMTWPWQHTSYPVLVQLQQCVLSSYLPPCSSPPHKQPVKCPGKGRGGQPAAAFLLWGHVEIRPLCLTSDQNGWLNQTFTVANTPSQGECSCILAIWE